jgi:hypothetical protein
MAFWLIRAGEHGEFEVEFIKIRSGTAANAVPLRGALEIAATPMEPAQDAYFLALN